MKLYSFGGITLPTTLQQEVFPVGGRESLVTLRDGAFDEDGADLVLAPYSIERNFDVTDTVECAEDVDIAIDRLLMASGGGRRILSAVMRDGDTYRQTFAKLVVSSRQRNLDMQAHQPMTARFLVDYPYWMATADEPHYLDNGYRLDAGWTLDGFYDSRNITLLSITYTLHVDGTAPIRRGLITLDPVAGCTITNPRIYNATNGMWIQYTGSLANPNQLSLDLLPKSAKLNWVGDVYSAVSIGPGQMDWMRLELGDNIITVTCTALTGIAQAVLRWFYSRHYL